VLLNEVVFAWIVFDVYNDATHIIRGVEENFARARGPHRVIRRNGREEAKPLGSLFGEFVPHGLRIVTVAPNAQMYVIAHDCAGPDCVTFVRYDLLDRFAEGLPLRVVEPQQRKIELLSGVAREFTQLFARRLRALSSFVHGPKIDKLLLTNFVGPAAAGVVWQPMPVSMQNQMVSDDDSVVRPHINILHG
jgi:hypothetical protein